MRNRTAWVWLALIGLALVAVAFIGLVRHRREKQVNQTHSLIGSVEVELGDYLKEHPGWLDHQPMPSDGAWRPMDEAQAATLLAELDKGIPLDVPPRQRKAGQIRDAWGRPLRISIGRSPEGGVLYEIASAGRDGAWDTDDDLRRNGIGGELSAAPATTRSAGP